MHRVIHLDTSGPSRAALVAIAIVAVIVALPLLLLAGLALLVIAAVAAGAALLKGGLAKLRGLVRGDGRSNVRVIR
jgi:hypothetical protein